MKDELMDRTTVAEAHFGLGRVNVNVHVRRIDLDKDAVGRVTAAVQHVLIGFAQRVAEQLVAHETAIYIHVLRVAARARVRWRRAVAEDTQAVALSAICVAQRFAGVD